MREGDEGIRVDNLKVNNYVEQTPSSKKTNILCQFNENCLNKNVLKFPQ